LSTVVERAMLYSLAALTVFVSAALIGFIFPSTYVLDAVSGVRLYAALPPLTRAAAIFVNNVFVAFMLLLSSFTVLVGLYLLAFNGYVLGVLLAFSSKHHPLPTLLFAIAPHGIIEVAVYSYLVGVALSLVEAWLKKRIGLEEAATYILKACTVAVLGLAAAALIESFMVLD